MVGQGMLIECLESPHIESVLVLGRRTCGVKHPKLSEVLLENFLNLSAIEDSFTGYNACFWCLGTTSLRLTEAQYRLVTVDYTHKMAEALAQRCNDLTFCYVSGAGADQSLQSKIMWVRVKGEAENSLKQFGFKGLYFFRPAYIHPMKGVRPSFVMYRISWFLYPIFKLLMPKQVSTTVQVGKAMINAARIGYEKQILDSADIVRLSQG